MHNYVVSLNKIDSAKLAFVVLGLRLRLRLRLNWRMNSSDSSGVWVNSWHSIVVVDPCVYD
jgi:hypothetical protein